MVNKTQFLELFREQCIGDDTDKIEMQTKFRDLGSWDSLTGMAVLVTIKDSYNVDIPVDDFMACTTVQDVYDYIEKKAI